MGEVALSGHHYDEWETRGNLVYVRPTMEKAGVSLTLNGKAVRVVLRRTKISVGCTDVTPEALRHLLAEYDKRFGNCEEIVLQP